MIASPFQIFPDKYRSKDNKCSKHLCHCKYSLLFLLCFNVQDPPTGSVPPSLSGFWLHYGPPCSNEKQHFFQAVLPRAKLSAPPLGLLLFFCDGFFAQTQSKTMEKNVSWPGLPFDGSLRIIFFPLLLQLAAALSPPSFQICFLDCWIYSRSYRFIDLA